MPFSATNPFTTEVTESHGGNRHVVDGELCGEKWAAAKGIDRPGRDYLKNFALLPNFYSGHLLLDIVAFVRRSPGVLLGWE
jgi:hypothetical protein